MKHYVFFLIFITCSSLTALHAQNETDLKLIFEKAMIQAELQVENQLSPTGLLKIDIVKNNFFSSETFQKWEGFTINYINKKETWQT